jgi:hypothetical protein
MYYNTRKSTCLIRTRYGGRVYWICHIREKPIVEEENIKNFIQSNLYKQIISSIRKELVHVLVICLKLNMQLIEAESHVRHKR